MCAFTPVTIPSPISCLIVNSHMIWFGRMAEMGSRWRRWALTASLEGHEASASQPVQGSRCAATAVLLKTMKSHRVVKDVRQIN